MVKTTVILDDEVYRRLVEESVRRYGSTKKLSFLINEKLREPRGGQARPPARRMTVRLGRRVTAKELEAEIARAWEEA